MFPAKLIFILLTCLAALLPVYGFAAESPNCTKDACLDAVRKGHRPHGPGACKKFLRATVTPKMVISTTTVTVSKVASSTITTVITADTSTVPATSVDTLSIETDSTTTTTFVDIGKRTVTNKPHTTSPTSVPKYASSACRSPDTYSSACSCVGFTKTITTVAARTSIKTVTKYHNTVDITTTSQTTTPFTTQTTVISETATTTITSIVTETPFTIRVSLFGPEGDSLECADSYMSSGGGGPTFFFCSIGNVGPGEAVTTYYIDAATDRLTTLDGKDNVYFLNYPSEQEYMTEATPQQGQAYDNYVESLTWSIDPSTHELTCYHNGNQIKFGLTYDGPSAPSNLVVEPGGPLTLTAIYL